MRARFRHILSIMAITAVALHSASWSGAATSAVAAAFDPFSVICHSDGNTDTAPDQAPAGSTPSHACDHCNLCASTPPPAASPTTAVIQLLINQASYVLGPIPAFPRGGVEVALHGARGPPVLV
jgi:hypothetical protein